ncbi:hypothetical protein MRB53_017077 [Persea americana]|uniref:Uncharacterized protein n=1 Tax=Persea americana TaxID=3435 RepID=A0ACC2M4M1_PERAE|nr:hypothetical protein MRB53_017077 [Persea americana]
MESWNDGPEGRGLVLSDEMVSSSSDALARRRKLYPNWDLKIPCNHENSTPLTVGVAFGNHGFKELKGEMGSGRVVSHLFNPKMLIGEEASSGLRALSSVGEDKTRDSSLIDLKLGRLVDYSDTKSGKSIKKLKVSSAAVSSSVTPVKRSRLANSNGQAPLCQVHGCNMDLSSSKDYHKKHKVCEIHCKTTRVTVNGIEQRFCQQCSRFHLLAEFDDVKRSCRKRLAGHNERRRKPQLENHSARIGSKFIGTSLPAGRSFIFPDIFPSGIVPELNYEKGNWCRHLKIENEANTQPLIPVVNGHSVQKPCHSAYDTNTVVSGVSYENVHHYVQNVRDLHSIFQDASSGTKEFSSFSISPTVEGLGKVLDSSCALSLLSTQSQNSPRNLSAIPIAWPLTVQGGSTHYSVGQFTDKLMAVSSQPSAIIASNRFSSPGMEHDHMEAELVSDASNTFDAQVDSNFRTSGFVNSNDSFLFREHGNTVDLLQLSRQLDNAELQRHSVQVKQESGNFCFLHMT